MFITLIVVMVSVCAYVHTHQVLYVKSTQFYAIYTSIKLIKQRKIKLRGIQVCLVTLENTNLS